jgi:exonuclease SbcC
LRQKYDRLGRAIEDRRKARDEALAGAAAAREESARLAAERAAFQEGLRGVDRTLAPFLPLCDLATADLDRDLAGATRRLSGKGEEVRAARARAEQAETSAAELARRLAIVAVEARGATQAAASCEKDRATRGAALAALRAQRGDLLGGEPTASHRTRCNDKRLAAQQTRDRAARERAETEAAKAGAERDLAHAAETLAMARTQSEEASSVFARALADAELDEETALALLDVSTEQRAALRARLDAAEAAAAAAATEKEARARDLAAALADGRPEPDAESLEAARAGAEQALETLARRLGEIGERLSADDVARAKAQTLSDDIAAAEAVHKSWAEVDAAVGSATGDKFRRFAQSVTLERLVALANLHLETLTPRYRLERSASEVADLGLQIVDRDLCDERRSTRSLSGGERFLASLSLALGLCSLEGRGSFVDTLFIDEGFGTLDQATLDVAVDALEQLQGQGRKVGVISHVESLRQRIAVQIRVEMRGGGRSAVRVEARSALLV